jgi:UDP-N-acetylglucosamine--N-acetylmuramyl-(pentapeptide) pyrophosphoryl-undecaprenol N-acetylglucosamine transferase
VGKPVILVPSPNVAEDHQTKNAMALAEKDAAIVVSDDKAGKRLVDEAIKLVFDNQKKKSLSENIARMAEPDADIRIAREVLKLIKE